MPLDASAIAHMLETPIRLVRQVLYDLAVCGILAPMKTEDHKDPAYQPARDIDALTIQYVLTAVEKYGVEAIPLLQSKELAVLRDSLREFESTISASKANKLLREIR